SFGRGRGAPARLLTDRQGTRGRDATRAGSRRQAPPPGRHDGAMRLQKLGHSCLLVESGDARLLIDPGTFSSGFEGLEGLTAVLVTHQHPDHLDIDRLPGLLERNPSTQVIADA